MGKKHIKLLLVVMLIALVMASFSACGLLKPKTVQVSEVSIDITSGLTKEGNTYYAYIGDDVVFTANWNKNANVNIGKEWKLYKGDEVVDTATTKVYAYTVPSESPDFEATYKVTLTINGIESSNKVSFKIRYAPLRIENIQSNVKIYNDVLQMSRFDYKTVNLEVHYNLEAINPDIPVTFSWKKGSTEEATTNTYSFTPTDGWDDETTISITLTQGEDSVTKSFKVVLVMQYLEIKGVEIEFTNGTGTEPLATTQNQVIQKGSGPVYNPVTLSAVVAPAVGTNTDAEVTWTIRTKDGPITATEHGRVLTFNPTYGENIVTCTIQNVSSHTFNVIAMTTTDYDQVGNTLKNTFEWEGNVCNRYITDKYDMLALANYLVANRDLSAQVVYYVEDSIKSGNTMDHDAFELYMKDVVAMIDEAGMFGYSWNSNTNFSLTSSCVFGDPTQTTEADDSIQNLMDTHYSTSTTTRTTLPCDSFTKSMTVTNSNQLFRALSNFYKPTISDPTLTALYNKARDVLKDICDDDMTDYEKVLAIYDWIVTEVKYDTVLFDSDGGINYDGYYLEGVFNNHKAVCDGKAKAFTLLCGMEGITSIRVSGKAKQPRGGSTSGHAWNKVLVDTPNEAGEYDGIKDWFVVDTTWGDRTISFNGQSTENLSYSYFLIQDSDISNTHTQSRTDLPVANKPFDYYKCTIVERNSKSAPLKVTSNVELAAVLEYYLAKVGANHKYAIEIEVAITGVNSDLALEQKIQETMNNILIYHDPNGKNFSQYTIYHPSHMNKDMNDAGRSDIYLLYYLLP